MGTGKGGNNQKKDVYSTPDDVTTAMAAVERWLGNPVSLSLLNFVATNDECGNRLSNAIDAYLGTKKDLCWKCRLAGKIVGYTLHKSSNLFGVDESEIRGGLKETVFRRGLVNVLKRHCALRHHPAADSKRTVPCGLGFYPHVQP